MTLELGYYTTFREAVQALTRLQVAVSRAFAARGKPYEHAPRVDRAGVRLKASRGAHLLATSMRLPQSRMASTSKATNGEIPLLYQFRTQAIAWAPT